MVALARSALVVRPARGFVPDSRDLGDPNSSEPRRLFALDSLGFGSTRVLASELEGFGFATTPRFGFACGEHGSRGFCVPQPFTLHAPSLLVHQRLERKKQ